MGAPTSLNTQPWNFHVVAGAMLDRIRAGNVERNLSGVPHSHEFRMGPAYEGVHRERADRHRQANARKANDAGLRNTVEQRSHGNSQGRCGNRYVRTAAGLDSSACCEVRRHDADLTLPAGHGVEHTVHRGAWPAHGWAGFASLFRRIGMHLGTAGDQRQAAGGPLSGHRALAKGVLGIERQRPCGIAHCRCVAASTNVRLRSSSGGASPWLDGHYGMALPSQLRRWLASASGRQAGSTHSRLSASTAG